MATQISRYLQDGDIYPPLVDEEDQTGDQIAMYPGLPPPGMPYLPSFGGVTPGTGPVMMGGSSANNPQIGAPSPDMQLAGQAPDIQSGSQGTPMGLPPSPAPPPDSQPPNVGFSNYIDTLQQRPTFKSAPWYRQLPAAVLGGLAGWSNAASRTRRPIDTANAQGEILHPGFQEQMRAYDSQLAKGQPIVAAQSAQQLNWLHLQQEQAQDRLRQSEAQRAQAQSKWYMDRSGTKWHLNPKTGNIFSDNGEVQQMPQNKDEYYAHLVNDMGFNPRDAQEIAYTGKLTPQPRQTNANEWQTRLDAAGGDPKKALATRLQEEITKARASKTVDPYAPTPGGPGNGQPTPLPKGNGGVPDVAIVDLYRRQAGGDRNATRQLLMQNGWRVQ
jgi:hypothetical protein